MPRVSEFDAQPDTSSTNLARPPRRLRPPDEFGDSHESDTESATREGLPPSYRMRADRHYIDRMSDSVGVPVRLIPVDRLELGQHADRPSSDALVHSIAAHGVLQPLLVANRDGGYRVIAGRKRLAAAIAAGLKAVPCLIHDIGDADVAAFASAENVRGDAREASDSHSLSLNVADLLQELTADLTRLDRSVALLRHSPGGSVYHRTALDLVAAEAWRAGWLARASAFLVGRRHPTRRRRPLVAIVDQVAQGFEPELRLAGGELRTFTDVGAGVSLDESLGELAISGVVVCGLFLLQDAEQPVIELRASASGDVVTVESTQPSVAMPPELVRLFSEGASAGKGQFAVGLAALLLRAIASQHQGSVEVTAEGGEGSGVRCRFQV